MGTSPVTWISIKGREEWKSIVGREDAQSLYLATRKFCKQQGVPVDDPEYDSAINYAVFRAMRTKLRKGRGQYTKRIELCILYATRSCIGLRRAIAGWRKNDLLGASRGRLPPVTGPIRLDDFELLCFTAAHGRMRAAKLLGIDVKTLRGMLDDTAFRIREGVATADPPPQYLLGEDGESQGMSFHPG